MINSRSGLIAVVILLFSFSLPSKEVTTFREFSKSPRSAIPGYIITNTIADADTYVSSRYPTTNYGFTGLRVAQDRGSGSYLYESYLHFNFSSKPASFLQAELSLRLFSWGFGTDLSISLVNSSWDENTMTWANKPPHDNLLETFSWSAYGIKKIDITPWIYGSGLSICVNSSTASPSDEINIIARDGWPSYAPEEAPQIIWTASGEVGYNVTGPTASSSIGTGFNTITWNTLWAPSNRVDIQLFKGGVFVKTIATSEPNNGEYSDWIVYVSDNFNGNDYRIKILDSGDSNIYGWSEYFTINVSSHYIAGYNLILLMVVGIIAVSAMFVRLRQINGDRDKWR